MAENIVADENIQIDARSSCYSYTLFDLNPDPVFCLAPDGEILDVNAAAERVAGRQRDQMVGQHFSDFLSPQQLPAAADAFEAVSAGHAVVHETLTITRPDGDEVVLDVSAYPSMSRGRLLAICGMARDVTARVAEREELRRSEQALRDSEELFRQLIGNIDQVFYLTCRRTGELIYVSPQYEELWGQSIEEAHADETAWLRMVHPEDRARVESEAFRKDDYDVEYRLLRPDGSLRWVHDKGFPVRDNDGEVTRVAGIVEDVTDQKLLEEQLRQAQKMESVGQLAGGVAHDFNNLLMVILNAARFLDEGLPPHDRLREDVELISRAGERGAALVRQLLAFSRRQIVNPKVLNVNDVVDEMETLLRRTVGEKVEFLVKKDPRLALTLIDPNQLGQILINLMVNAGDAMPSGGTISLETANVSLAEDMDEGPDRLLAGEYVCISVSDTGHGIAKEHVPKVFEPFFSTKGKAEASGLGLSMVYGIVTQAGGKVSVYSEPRVGTTFKVYLPAVEGSVEVPSRRPRLRPRRSRDEVVLLAEDDAEVRTAVAKMLQHEGFNVLHASSGSDALNRCRSHEGRLDLLLTDVVMPGMSGRELAIHVQTARPDIRIVYMSGYSEDMIGRHGILQVDDNYLQKPFTSAALIEKIEQVLRRR